MQKTFIRDFQKVSDRMDSMELEERLSKSEKRIDELEESVKYLRPQTYQERAESEMLASEYRGIVDNEEFNNWIDNYRSSK